MALLSSCISLGYANICQVENKIHGCNDLGANAITHLLSQGLVLEVKTSFLPSLGIKI